MSVYYEVLRPASRQDLEAAGPGIAAALEKLPPGGYVEAGGLQQEEALAWACSRGMMRRLRLGGRVLGFESVRFWISQLGAPKTRNVSVAKGTRRSYAAALDAFNGWLAGREYPVRESVVVDGRIGERNARRSFADVEDLLRFCEGSDHGAITARRVLKQYLADSAAAGCPLPTALMRCAAIKSYFAAHDVQVSVKVNRNRYPAGGCADRQMGLNDLYKMMTAGRMDAMAKAVMMVKFQAGLDASTLADRFNFEAYGQIIRHFGIEDYEAWDLDRCPVPIRLVRVKTNMAYTTFIDRDAVVRLQDYLRWKEYRHRKKHEAGSPLFVTQRGAPVNPEWVSQVFSRAAAHAGIQRRVSAGSCRVRSHEARDLLKSTLLVAGCAPYAADHVLGHYPRDSYEKQAILYPEAVRREYAKASGMINIFTGIERYLGTADRDRPDGKPEGRAADQEVLDQVRLVREDLRRMAGAVAGVIRAVARDDLPEEALRSIRDLEGDGPGQGG